MKESCSFYNSNMPVGMALKVGSLYIYSLWSQNCSVGIVTRLGAGCLDSLQELKIFLFSKMSIPALCPTQHLLKWVLGSLTQVCKATRA